MSSKPIKLNGVAFLWDDEGGAALKDTASHKGAEGAALKDTASHKGAGELIFFSR